MAEDDSLEEASHAGRSGEPVYASELKAIRASVQAADPLILTPGALLELVVHLQQAMLTALAEAERTGMPDRTMTILGDVWHEVVTRQGRR